VISNGWRLAHKYHSADATFVNVFWLLSSAASDEEDLFDCFSAAWSHAGSSFAMINMQSSDIHYDGADITKLDGMSPTVFVPYDSSTSGAAGAGMVAAQAALVITWNTGERGRNNRGRSYIAGLPQAALETGSARWANSTIADAQDAVGGFLTGLTTGSPAAQLLVVSQHSVHGPSHLFVLSGTPRQGLGTQRRRTERTHP